MIKISALLLPLSLEVCRWSRVHSTVFSPTFYRVTFLLPQVITFSVMRLSRITCHREGQILHKNLVLFFCVSNEIFLSYLDPLTWVNRQTLDEFIIKSLDNHKPLFILSSTDKHSYISQYRFALRKNHYKSWAYKLV